MVREAVESISVSCYITKLPAHRAAISQGAGFQFSQRKHLATAWKKYLKTQLLNNGQHFTYSLWMSMW